MNKRFAYHTCKIVPFTVFLYYCFKAFFCIHFCLCLWFISQFWISCLPFGFPAPKVFKLYGFSMFCLWEYLVRLFQKRVVHVKLDIYLIIGLNAYLLLL